MCAISRLSVGNRSVRITEYGFSQSRLELVSLNARQQKESIHLVWQTASEINNAGFEVQRSSDGQKWDGLDFVPGNGTTLEKQSYTFTDGRPLPGLNYYRLKQVDFDGSFTYSKTISVDFGKEERITIFPNPAYDELTIQLPESEQSSLIGIYDLSGKKIMQANAQS